MPLYLDFGMMPERYRTKEWLSHFMDDFKEPAKKIAASGKLFDVPQSQY